MIVKSWIAVTLVAALMAPSSAAVAQDKSKEGGRVGLLVVDHGEPPEYNEYTYESFREFFKHLMDMGLIPWWLELLDTGTIVQDANCYACSEASEDPYLIDAWLDHRDGPAAYVPGSDSLPAHYVLPGGPGLGEPDIFEHVGLGAWNEWQLMGGRSPNFDQKLAKKRAAFETLNERYPGLPIRVGYGIDPRLDGRSQGFRPAIAALINRDRVDHIVVAYHGVGFSDIMQTHMIRHEVEKIVAAYGKDVSISYANPIGTSGHYVDAVVDQVRNELNKLPSKGSVAIHLSGHGLSTTTCGEYDCGSDAYHESSNRLFERTRAAIMRRVEHPGRFGVFHLYGDGATEEDDPEDKVDSPMEALAERKKGGFRYVIDIPYEFDSDSRDTLIILRRGYERPIPDWDRNFESRFEYEGIDVRITNAQFGSKLKIASFLEVIEEALERAAKHPSDGGHQHSG